MDNPWEHGPAAPPTGPTAPPEPRDPAATDRFYAQLHADGRLTAPDARAWVAALGTIDCDHRDANVLRDLAEAFPDEPAVIDFVASELWRRAAALSEAAGPTADLTMAQLAWGTTLLLAPPIARSDEDATRIIGLVDHLFQSGRRRAAPVASFAEFEQVLLRLAASGPRAALRAADLLAAEAPVLALELVAGREESADTTLVAAVASSELDDFPRAATLFDHLALRWGLTARDLDLEDRSRWIQAMTDVGRFDEAEQACAGTIAALDEAGLPGAAAPDGRPGAWSCDGVTRDSFAHWRHSYRLLAYRLAAQRGEFRAAWDHLRAAAVPTSGPEGGVPVSDALRRSVLRVRLVFADRAAASAILDELARLAELDPCDSTFAEACLLADARWGTATGDAGASDPLAGVRFHGQAAARAILARSDCPLGSRQRLRLALLAGDDDRAAAMLAAEPIGEGEPWTVSVLGAMSALRRSEDAEAAALLGRVLPGRRHDLDLRVLAAQAALLTGDYKAAMSQARSLTAGVPGHILGRTILAEGEFESALAMSDEDDLGDGVENAQMLMAAVADYRRAADLHRDTVTYLVQGGSGGSGRGTDGRDPRPDVGSEPLAPALFAEVCRRGMHAAILAQEGLARLGLRGDRQLVMDARDLTHHLRSIDHACCRAASGTRASRLAHQVRHLWDRDEASRLALLMISYQRARWTKRISDGAFLLLGLGVVWLALLDRLPGPPSESIRLTVLGVGVLLMLMPFARSLKVGVVELSRDAPPAPLSGRSKSLRTSRLLLRSHHLGTFALPAPPDKGRRAHQTARTDEGTFAIPSERA